MRCSKCGSDNREGRKFCTTCGTPLVASCPHCSAPIEPGERFCGECGAALIETRAPTAQEVAPPAPPTMGERRHLTVLFCDLVGSTAIAAQLDPEEWRETVADYQRAAAETITCFGGHVAKYLGDGVMAFFGYPEAHDNDAERAARAALAILDAISKLNEQTERPKLAARVGIDSGLVVVGAGAGKDADVFGEAPNVAARVQSAAEPGSVLITDAVHRLVSGLFVVEDRGAHELKGIERPLQFYKIVQPSGVHGRLAAVAAAHGLTPFVGREDELHLLMNRRERTLDGEGQVVLIIGEAGIGKSRLLQRFREQSADRQYTWLEAAAAPFFQNTPFYLICELLPQLAGLRGDLSVDEQLIQLKAALLTLGLDPDEAIPLIAPLLNLSLPAKYPASTLPPEQQRRRLLATLVEWVLSAARIQPLVLATEDLHWADASTLELVQLLAEQGAMSRLMFLYTARPEFHPQWPLRSHHTQVTLNRLKPLNVRDMIAQVAARNVLAGDTVDAIVERTGGVPLFVEELTRAVLESGSGKLRSSEIPVTLHDSLMARLDRLGPAKAVIQIGAVIGSEFAYELLRAVHPIAERDLLAALLSATDAELVYVRGIAPDAIYQFKHALIRDAAYEALLKSRRKELHRLVALAIRDKFPVLREARPEVLARHWTEAGETEPAIAGWSRAGKAAETRNAFMEALDSYQRGVELLELVPESPERDRRELELRQSVVSMLRLTSGYTAPQTIDATERTALLAEKSGNLAQLVHSAVSRFLTALNSGDLSTASAMADQALELGAREDSPTDLAVGHTMQVNERYYRGDLAGAEKHFTIGLKYFDEPGFRALNDSPVSVFGHASYVAWTLGRATVAREREAQMTEIADIENPYQMALSSYRAAYLRVHLKEYEQAEILAAQALNLSAKERFPYLVANSQCILGHAQAQLGRDTDAIRLIRKGIAGLLERGTLIGIGNFTGFLAAAQERAGALDDALETVEQALRANPDELVYRPEILRIRGELRLRAGRTDLGETDFREAIELAQKMSAKAWELRTTTSLTRVLASEGRRDEALIMLAEIYGWFTEGFDTADLKEAKALLDELAT